MPLPISLAHKLSKRLAEVRKANVLPYLRPDGKTQVTVRYELDEHGIQRAVEIERLLISTQHRDGLDIESLMKPDLLEHVVEPILHADYRGLYDPARLSAKDFLYVNPTGKFVIGGPMGDTGLTGRKIVVDTYGGAAPHGGGAFSGQGSDEGRPLGCVRRASRRQERRRRRPCRPLPAPGRIRDRGRAPDERQRRLLRHRGDSARPGSRSSSPSTSTSARARSSAISTCCGRSTRRRPRTATSAARTATSRGSARTRRTHCARPPACSPRLPRNSCAAAAKPPTGLPPDDRL